MPLDKLDQKLILELYKDARQSNADLGKTLLCSKEVIHYRINRLQQQGIITKYIPIINYSRLGYTIYRLQIKFTSKNLASWISYFKTLPQTSWIVELQGNWDIVVLFWIKQQAEIFTLVDKIKQHFGEHIQSTLLTIVDAIHYFAPHYITSDQKLLPQRTTYLMKTSLPPYAELSPLQYNLLSKLISQGKQSSLSLAQELDSSATNIQYHLKQLHKEKIILGYIPVINPSALGYTHLKLVLNLHNPAQKLQLKQYLSQQPHVIYITESYGNYDLEFECVAKDLPHLFHFLDILTTHIPLKNYDIIYNNKEILVNQIPHD